MFEEVKELTPDQRLVPSHLWFTSDTCPTWSSQDKLDSSLQYNKQNNKPVGDFLSPVITDQSSCSRRTIRTFSRARRTVRGCCLSPSCVPARLHRCVLSHSSSSCRLLCPVAAVQLLLRCLGGWTPSAGSGSSSWPALCVSEVQSLEAENLGYFLFSCPFLVCR